MKKTHKGTKVVTWKSWLKRFKTQKKQEVTIFHIPEKVRQGLRSIVVDQLKIDPLNAVFMIDCSLYRWYWFLILKTLPLFFLVSVAYVNNCVTLGKQPTCVFHNMILYSLRLTPMYMLFKNVSNRRYKRVHCNSSVLYWCITNDDIYYLSDYK